MSAWVFIARIKTKEKFDNWHLRQQTISENWKIVIVNEANSHTTYIVDILLRYKKEIEEKSVRPTNGNWHIIRYTSSYEIASLKKM